MNLILSTGCVLLVRQTPLLDLFVDTCPPSLPYVRLTDNDHIFMRIRSKTRVRAVPWDVLAWNKNGEMAFRSRPRYAGRCESVGTCEVAGFVHDDAMALLRPLAMRLVV